MPNFLLGFVLFVSCLNQAWGVDPRVEFCETSGKAQKSEPAYCPDGSRFVSKDLCQSCAYSLQSKWIEKDDLSEVQDFLSDEIVEIGKNGVKPTCAKDLGQRILKRDLVRRRLRCRELKDAKDAAAIIARQEKLYPPNDGLGVTAAGKQEILRRVEALKQDYRISNHCSSPVSVKLDYIGYPITSSQAHPFTKEEAEENLKRLWKEQHIFCTGIEKYRSEGEGRADTHESLVMISPKFQSGKGYLTDTEVNSAKDQIEKEIEALKKRVGPECVGALKSVTLEPSCNRLRNPEGYEPWDYEALARDRAIAVQNKVLPLIEGGSFYDPKKVGVHVRLSEHGKGSSGPCPYQLVEENVNGIPTYNVKLDPDYAEGGPKEEEMVKARQVKVKLYIENKCKSPIEKGKSVEGYQNVGCATFKPSCV